MAGIDGPDGVGGVGRLPEEEEKLTEEDMLTEWQKSPRPWWLWLVIGAAGAGAFVILPLAAYLGW